MQQSLSCLNSEAVAHLKASKHVEAIVAFDKLFKRLDRKHLTHAHLHTCHNNRAAAFLHLQLYDEALQDAEKARKLAEASLKRCSPIILAQHAMLPLLATSPNFLCLFFAGLLRLLVHMSRPSQERPMPL